MQIEVVDLADLRPDELNPRQQVPERLEAVALSLSRFGHVLPVFADTEGRLASGHQRTQAARMLGATRVPVVRLPTGDNLLRAGRLMLFNLATNDTPDRLALTALAEGLDLPELVRRLLELPEIDVDDPEAWPCMQVAPARVDWLLERNPEVALADDGLEGSRALAREPYRVQMPIVVDADGRVVCGRQRLSAAALLARDEWPVVRVDHETELMALALNKLSMEYDLSGFQDVLRASTWLNHMRVRDRLGIGFTRWVAPDRRERFDILDPDSAAAWKAVHGEYVADLGAGHLVETGLLTKAGVRSVAFEPFVMDGNRVPDRELTRRMTALFLSEIARGRVFDSVFISAVLNQVPYEEDRFRLLTLAQALSGPRTVTYITTQSHAASEWKRFQSGRRSSRERDFDLRLPGPEPATVLSSIAMGRVMVTKYHTAPELRHLCEQVWRTVEIESASSSHFVRCTDPRRLKPSAVKRMIAHEFDLPWRDGERLGMVDEATAAFEQRLGLNLR